VGTLYSATSATASQLTLFSDFVRTTVWAVRLCLFQLRNRLDVRGCQNCPGGICSMKIVCGTDFSQHAAEAGRVAATLAAVRKGSVVLLVHVFEECDTRRFRRNYSFICSKNALVDLLLPS
jgi:hypothetical protein